MPVANYKMLFEQNAKDVVSLEDFALACYALIEAAEETAENSPYSYRIRLDALLAIKRACEEVLENLVLEVSSNMGTKVA